MKTGAHEVIVFDPKVRGLVGYARVSRQDQNLDGQLDALRKHGVGRVFAERVSSVGSRPGWGALLDTLRAGDVVCVTRLDRIGRRLSEVVSSVQGLVDEGIHVRALAQSVDTSAPGGAIIMALWAALAETERETLRERTREGLAAAKARGKHAGRPVVLDEAKRELCQHLRAKDYSIQEIAKAVKAGATTVRRALRDADKSEPRQLRIGEVVESEPHLHSTAQAEERFALKARRCQKAGGHQWRPTDKQGGRICSRCGLEQYGGAVPAKPKRARKAR